MIEVRIQYHPDTGKVGLAHSTDLGVSAHVLDLGATAAHAMLEDATRWQEPASADDVPDSIETLLALGLIVRAKMLIESRLRAAKPASPIVLAQGTVPAGLQQ